MSVKSVGLVQVTAIPLVEAVIEVRFPGDARIDTFRGEYQQAIRSEFPLLFVPRVGQGDAPALLHYRFRNEADTRSVNLAIHSLAYMTKEYPGWEVFLSEFTRYWKLLEENITPEKLTRVGVRYINRFDEELIDKMNLDAPPPYMTPLAARPKSYKGTSRIERGEHILAVNILLEDNGALTVDFDVSATDVQPDALQAILGALHDKIEAEFTQVVTGDFARELQIS